MSTQVEEAPERLRELQSRRDSIQARMAALRDEKEAVEAAAKDTKARVREAYKTGSDPSDLHDEVFEAHQARKGIKDALESLQADLEEVEGEIEREKARERLTEIEDLHSRLQEVTRDEKVDGLLEQMEDLLRRVALYFTASSRAALLHQEATYLADRYDLTVPERPDLPKSDDPRRKEFAAFSRRLQRLDDHVMKARHRTSLARDWAMLKAVRRGDRDPLHPDQEPEALERKIRNSVLSIRKGFDTPLLRLKEDR